MIDCDAGDQRQIGESDTADAESVDSRTSAARPAREKALRFDAGSMFAAIACVVCLERIGAMLASFVTMETYSTEWYDKPAPVIAFVAVDILAIATLLVYIRFKKDGKRLTGLCPPAKRSSWPLTLAMAVVLCVVLFLISMGLAEFNSMTYDLDRIWLPRQAYHTFRSALRAGIGGPDFLLVPLRLVVLTPVVEELIFRGVGVVGVPLGVDANLDAIMWTSTAFAFYHGPSEFFFLFPAGLLFVFVRLRTGSLYCSILAHSLVNLAAVLYVLARAG